jgi:Xaa-Pro dipeptidase
MQPLLEESYSRHVAVLQERAERALAETGFDRLLIHSGRVHEYFADDQEAPFKPGGHFAHWSPVEGPAHLLEVRPGKRARLLRVTPPDFWYEPPAAAPAFVSRSIEVVDLPDSEAAWREVRPAARTAFVGEGTEEAPAHGIGAASVNPPKLVARLDWDRAYKTPYEEETLFEANRVAADGFRAAKDAFRSGASEMEIHHAFLSACGTTEAALPYPTIVAQDEKSAVLHYQRKRDRGAVAATILLLDAGAPLRGYGSDITRTWTAAGADPVFAALVAGMEALQQRLCAAVRPGIPYLDLHVAAHRGVAELLTETEVVKGSADQAFDAGLTRPFFPHGLGHFLGIQVHDVGGRLADRDGAAQPPPPFYPFLRTTRTIEERMVFTIEPGLYFIPMLLEPLRQGEKASLLDWTLVDRLVRSGGIRIEDDLLVTADGHRNLTRPHLPH